MPEFEVLRYTPRHLRGFMAELNWGPVEIALLYETYDRDPPAILQLVFADGTNRESIEMRATALRNALRRLRAALDDLGPLTEDLDSAGWRDSLSEREAAHLRNIQTAPALDVSAEFDESHGERTVVLRAGLVPLGRVIHNPHGEPVFMSTPGIAALPDLWVSPDDLDKALMDAIDHVR